MLKEFSAILIALLLSPTLSASQVKRKPVSGTPGVSMKMHYTEIVPGENIEFKVGHKKYCPQDNLTVKRYESEEDLPSTETGKKVPVRVLNVHIRLFSPCSNNPSKAAKTLKISGDKKRMTHVYLFADTDMKVEL